ncbi:AAA ATPase AAA+ lid [Gracilaria domingensis]|nr:AAA ATPase AAA+ lid [Gracilaria domingensis]
MPSMQASKKKPKNRKGKRGTRARKAGHDQGRFRHMDPEREDQTEAKSSSEHPQMLSLDRVISRGPVLEARRVHLTCDADFDFLSSDECTTMLHAHLLGRALMPGMTVPVNLLGDNILFSVVKVNDDFDNQERDGPGPTGKGVYLCSKQTIVEVVLGSHTHCTKGQRTSYDLVSLAGLDRQVQAARSIVEAVISTKTTDNVFALEHSLLTKKPHGLLIHGPSGTGKIMMACALAASYRLNLEMISGPGVVGKSTSDALRTLENCFKRARRKSPSLVLLDEVDALAPRRDLPTLDDVQRKLTAALLTIMDNQGGSELQNIVVVGTTNRPDVIDAAMRRPGRFDREIETIVPNTLARVQILRNLVTEATAETILDELEKIAVLCYGYVGADIVSPWREAVSSAYDRDSKPTISVVDFKEALRKVRPSALREIAVEIPSTTWNDVGGKEEAKQRLKEAVEWPLSENGAQTFLSFGVTPPRGILLYGPPGCSKTLLARAVATESKANFISVNGAELLSKWVGESEKAVRNIFRRARQAAPCVIFFDEIDALATSRSFVAGASAQARVVAQLLSEMDGIDTERSNRVVVIAATNRPDCLDSAFLRPGRIDVQIYVGLPDHSERLSILNVHTRKVPLAEDVNLLEVASCTDGYSGAELAAVVRGAALCASHLKARQEY